MPYGERCGACQITILCRRRGPPPERSHADCRRIRANPFSRHKRIGPCKLERTRSGPGAGNTLFWDVCRGWVMLHGHDIRESLSDWPRMHPHPHRSSLGRSSRSQLPELLGEADQNSFGPPDIAEPIGILVLDQLVDQFCAALAEPGDRIFDVLDGEHDA